MTTVASLPASVVVYSTTYRKGCPGNASGKRYGYGLTPAAALAACEPWANQAPWLSDRCAPHTVTDDTGTRETEQLAWAAVGDISGNGDPEVDSLLQRGLYATAILTAAKKGLFF
jgi:hypothetical protein